ncbi:hypothetical protein PA99_3269 [Pseudomonas aeruginosa PA99]|nr:hypothetical protein PA99_3269 [Pseudomonas aeruginosa PA99]
MLRPAGPGLSGGTGGLHARRRRLPAGAGRREHPRAGRRAGPAMPDAGGGRRPGERPGAARERGRRRPPRLHHLYLRIHRTPQGRRHRARQRPCLPALGRPALCRRRMERGTGGDLGVLRPVGLRAVRHPGRRRHAAPGGKPVQPAGLPAPRRDQPAQYRALGVRRAARPRRPAGRGAHAEPGRRTAARPPGATDSWPTPGTAPGQSLRADRGHHLFDGARTGPARRSARRAAHRPTAARHHGGGARRLRGAAAAGRGRGTVPRRHRPGAWLFRQAGADRRAFPRRSGQRRAPLSHRRPRTHARGRRAGTPRPARRPGQVQRLPHRAGRDRLVPGEFSRGERSLRHAHRGQRRPASAGRLPGGAVRPAAPGAERAPWAKSAALHVAVGVRGPGGAAQDAQRQDRPQGPAASPGDRRRAPGAAQRSAGAGATPGLAGAAWCAAARRTGLLRRRRRFPAGGAPARDAAPATVPTRTVAGVRRWPGDPRGPAGTAAPGRARGRRAGAERRRRRAEPRRTAPVGGPATGAGGHLLQPAGPPAHSRRHGRRHRTGLAPVAGTACGAAPACRNGRRRAAAACAGGACGAPATPAGERRRPRRAVAGGWRAP